MSTYLPDELRRRLRDADDRRCAYCLTTEYCSGLPMVVDHIIPRSKDGRTEFENLCLWCHRCNEFKGNATSFQDPLTGETIALFHPRQQHWTDHFCWDVEGAKIMGITATGRATVVALQLNNDIIVPARRRWVTVGWHPPSKW
jgi:hypothetical protein